jgi:hypothetical protein
VESYAIEAIERGDGRATELVVMFVHTGWMPSRGTGRPFGGREPTVGPTTAARVAEGWPPEADGASCAPPSVAAIDDRTTNDTTNTAGVARAGARWGPCIVPEIGSAP